MGKLTSAVMVKAQRKGNTGNSRQQSTQKLGDGTQSQGCVGIRGGYQWCPLEFSLIMWQISQSVNEEGPQKSLCTDTMSVIFLIIWIYISIT